MELIRLILITMFVCLIIMQINTAIPPPTISTSKQTSLLSELKRLKYKFTTEINLRSPSNDTINITIEDPCDLKNKNKRLSCSINDPDSCKSCPYTTCEHFDQDFNLGPTSIPKNDEGKGYCVALKNMSSGCNKYHGDWVMIKASSYIKENFNSNTYIKFCLCKRPGFIGNVTLFGNCEHPFICDGDVIDINVSYEQIKCKCLNEFQSQMVGDEWHHCVPPSVKERNSWSTVPKPQKFAKSFINIEDYFHKLVRGDLGNLDELIDPCSRCPITGKPTFGGSVTIDTGHEDGRTVICRPADSDDIQEPNYGIPLRRNFHVGQDGRMVRLLKGSWGPDAMLAIKWKELWVYGSRNSDGRKQDCVYVFEYNDYNKDIYEKLDLNKEYQYAINVGPEALLGLTVLPMSTFTPMVVSDCFRGKILENSWATPYTCKIMAVNLAHHLNPSEIKDFLINSNHNNISSTFLTRTLQERHGWYPQDTMYWDSAQELQRSFGVATFNTGKATFQYLSYNPKIGSDPNLKKYFPFVGMRIKPMSEDDRKRSNWTRHKMSSHRHFLVHFVLTAHPEKSASFLYKDNHVADTSFAYK